MLDNDDFAYSYQKRPPQADSSQHAERSLITVDRSQKLDLLIHLLTNLQQSLIVCGPQGIGKTTLLNILEHSHKDIWPICMLQGSSALSFEAVVSQLSRFLNLSNASVTFDLSSLRAFCEKQKVVLIIDDAAELLPGLMGELMDFADSLAGLRLVFSMTNEELQAKTGTDSAIDDCHFIELPPLNQRQCLEYLQNLSAQPGSALSFSAINDALVEDMFQQTRGIPGKLLAELPRLSQYQSRQQHKFGLWFGIASVVIAAGVAVYTLLPKSTLENLFAKPAVEVAPTAIEQAIAITAEPEPEQNNSDYQAPAIASIPEPDTLEASPEQAAVLTVAPESKPEAENVAVMSVEPPMAPIIPTPIIAAAPEPLPIAPPIPPLNEEEQVVKPAEPDPKPLESKPVPATLVEKVIKPAEKSVEKALKPAEKPAPINQMPPPDPKPISSEPSDSNRDWILAQNADDYTIQVMVLSSKASVNRFMKQYALFDHDLKYYPIGKEGREKYVIIYGVFSSSVEALNTKSDMPSDFSHGIVKRFKYVQRESRRK